VCAVELRDEQLREALLVRCRAERIEPPGRIDRIIGSARTTFEKRFCDRTVSRLSDVSIDRLNNLIAIGAAPLASGRNLLAELKSDPGKVSLETLLREVDKLAAVRALELPADLPRWEPWFWLLLDRGGSPRPGATYGGRGTRRARRR
jgi:hypothetical protein